MSSGSKSPAAEAAEPQPFQSQTPEPENPLTEAFRALLDTADATPTEREAETFGPWTVRRVAEGYGVFRDWERPDSKAPRTVPPTAVFEQRSHALLFAAVLAPLCREPFFRLSPNADPRGFGLETIRGESWAAPVGRLGVYRPEIAEAMHLAEGLVRSPQALASLLEAAGPTTFELAVGILDRRLRERLREEEAG